MRLSDILSFNSGNTGGYNGTEFRRIVNVLQTVRDEDTGSDEIVTRRSVKTITEGTGKSTVTLVPMKSLSLEDFTFPFQSTSKIRDALKLQVMPFTAAGELEIFPVVLSKSGRISNGITWYVSPDELEVPSSEKGKIWPSPLPFISQLSEYDGNGVTMWVDEANVCSVLWQSNRPILYRWRKLSGNNTVTAELSWYDTYTKTRELERGGNFVFNAANNDYDEEDFIEIINESVKICSWINDVNLSRTVLEGARDLERTVRILSRVSLWLMLAGTVMLGAEILQWYRTEGEIQSVRSRSESFYRETFEPERTGRISNPVALARDKIASLSGHSEEAHPLDEALADLGEVCTSNKGITADIIRYSQDGLDCTGTAPDMTAVLNFRKSWEELANLVQVENTQFVSGIGYRFDLRIRW